MRRSLLGGVLVACLLAACGCELPGTKPEAAGGGGPPQRPPAPVTTALAVARDVPVFLDEIGRCVARETVTVRSQVAGQITTIPFADGASVKQGDDLFAIDPRPFQAALDSANATLAQNKAVLDLAKIETRRYVTLANEKQVPQETAEQKINAEEIAAAQVQSAVAAVETARLNLEYCRIRSPIEGRAGHRLVDLGNIVKVNDDQLVVIERLDPIFAEFAVTEHEFNEVKARAKEATLRVEVKLPDDSEPPAVGDLTFVDNRVDPGTGTLKLRATIPNPDHRFWPGVYVNARLLLRTIANAVLVPAAAVQISATGPFVYVIKSDDTAELRIVKPGQQHEDEVVVLDGLKAGERVVTIGHLAVTPGGKVKIVEPAPPAKQP